MPAAAMPHIFPCVQGGAKEVLSATQETWCPSTRNSTPMPSCADEDATCEVPRDGRNRRPPSLLAEALSSACPVPTPRVFPPGEVFLIHSAARDEFQWRLPELFARACVLHQDLA